MQNYDFFFHSLGEFFFFNPLEKYSKVGEKLMEVLSKFNFETPHLFSSPHIVFKTHVNQKAMSPPNSVSYSGNSCSPRDSHHMLQLPLVFSSAINEFWASILRNKISEISLSSMILPIGAFNALKESTKQIL